MTLFVPDRYNNMLLSSIPRISIYRGFCDNRKTSAHAYFNTNVLKAETIAGLYKTYIESDGDSFSESDNLDAGDVVENPLEG